MRLLYQARISDYVSCPNTGTFSLLEEGHQISRQVHKMAGS